MKLVTNVIQTFSVVKRFSDNSDRINGIDFSSDGNLLIASDDDSVVIYDCQTGVHKKTLPSRKYGADVIRFTRLGDSALHSSTKIDDGIRYLSLHDNKYIRYFSGHTQKVISLAVSQMHDAFLSGSEDNSIRAWDLRSPNCQGILPQTGKPLVCYSTDGIAFAVADNSEKIKLYDHKACRKPVIEFEIPKEDTTCEFTDLKFSHDGKWLLISTNGIPVHLVSAIDGKLLTTFNSRANTKGIPLEASFTPDSQFVFSGSTDGTIHVWDAYAGIRTTILSSDLSLPIHRVQFNPKFMMLASASTQLAFWLPSMQEDEL